MSNKRVQIDVARVRKYKEEYILSPNIPSRIRSVDNEIKPHKNEFTFKALKKFYAMPSMVVGFIFRTPIQADFPVLEDC